LIVEAIEIMIFGISLPRAEGGYGSGNGHGRRADDESFEMKIPIPTY